MFLLILGLFIGSVAVFFALQNLFSVTVTFLAWEITASLALIISVSILVGLIVAILFTIPKHIRNNFTIFKLKKENKKIRKELDLLKSKQEEVAEVAAPVVDKVEKALYK